MLTIPIQINDLRNAPYSKDVNNGVEPQTQLLQFPTISWHGTGYLALDQKCPNFDGDSINKGETRELWTDLAHKESKRSGSAERNREKGNESNWIENGAQKCNKGRATRGMQQGKGKQMFEKIQITEGSNAYSVII